MKLRQVDIAIYALFLALFKIYAIPQIFQQIYKVALVVFVVIFLITHAKLKQLVNLSLVFGAVVIFSSVVGYYSGVVDIQSIQNGILHAVCLYCVYTLILFCSSKKYLDGFINCIYNGLMVYCMISMISMMFLGHSSNGTEVTYFFGNKFLTSYYFIFYTALFMIKYWDKIDRYIRYRIVYFILALMTLLLCRWLYCSTAVVASILLIGASLLPKKIRQISMIPCVVLSAITLAAFLLLATDMVQENKVVQYIIVDILGKNLSLTGRVEIYSYLSMIIGQRKWFGYGYGNRAVAQAVGFGNAQNGLMQILIDYGIIGVIVFLGTTYYCLRKSAKVDKYWGLYMVLYAMILCSTVEISYNYIFYIALFCIRNISSSSTENPL